MQGNRRDNQRGGGNYNDNQRDGGRNKDRGGGQTYQKKPNQNNQKY